MSAENAHSLGAFGIVRNHHAAIACSTQVLRGVERETSVMTDGSGTSAFVFRTDRLCRIFDHNQMMLGGQFHHHVHVGHLSVKMDGNNYPSLAGYLGCNF